jgi:hypothetical protein
MWEIELFDGRRSMVSCLCPFYYSNIVTKTYVSFPIFLIIILILLFLAYFLADAKTFT